MPNFPEQSTRKVPSVRVLNRPDDHPLKSISSESFCESRKVLIEKLPNFPDHPEPASSYQGVLWSDQVSAIREFAESSGHPRLFSEIVRSLIIVGILKHLGIEQDIPLQTLKPRAIEEIKNILAASDRSEPIRHVNVSLSKVPFWRDVVRGLDVEWASRFSNTAKERALIDIALDFKRNSEDN